MRVLVLQYDIVWENKTANHQIVEAMLDEHGVTPGSFILLPELGDTGFSFNLDAIVDDQSATWACALARRIGCWIQFGYATRAQNGRGHNITAIADPNGKIVCEFHKIHPFSFGKEIEYYDGGQHLALHTCQPLGDESWNVCPLICYDLRFPELWRLGVQAGAELFTIGASWPAARQTHWRTLLIARAIENQAYVVASNRTGHDPALAYAGGSMIIAPDGTCCAEADDQPCVLDAEIDRTKLESWRATFPALNDIHDDLLGSIPTNRS